MTQTTEERLRAAVAAVLDPELERPLGDLAMVSHVGLDGARAQVTLKISPPESPVREPLEALVRTAATAVDGVESLDLTWDTEIPRTVPAGNDIIPGVRNLVLVGSGKGGVGKSTLTTSLALALASQGAKVGLMDADMYGPNQPTMLGVAGEPMSQGKKMVPFKGPADLRVISIGFFLKKDEPLIWRGPMLHGAVRQFLADVAWGDLDYLFIDLPPGTGDVQLTLSQMVPVSGAVMVTTPQAVSLEDMKKSALAMNKVNIPVLGIVENMSGYVCPHCNETEDLFGRGGGRLAAEEFEIPFLGEVPLDPRVMIGGDTGKPVILSHPEAPVSRALRRVARAVAVEIQRAAAVAPPPVPRVPTPLPTAG
ncbi:MAG: Mrp/NBP35 family ATP-binding protein [Acidobacteria bacterium]|nr:Mrp/NBP35 family ATP-binding protein [Acidobacteriota bacterium]